MDNYLEMKAQITNIVKAESFVIYKISCLRKYLDRKSMERLIHAFVSSRIDYCNSLLYGLPANDITKLQRVQNSADRLLTRSKKYDHITPILRELHWLPIQQRLKYKIALFTFKALHGMAPEYITELLSEYRSIRSLLSALQRLLRHPTSVNTSY